MSLAEKESKLKEIILKAFENRYGSVGSPDDWKILYNRLEPGQVVNWTLVTKKTSDQARILFIGKPHWFTDVGGFELQVIPNHGSGSGVDEIYRAEGTILVDEYREITAYISSPEFKEFQSTQQRISLARGGTLVTTKGHPVLTQR